MELYHANRQWATRPADERFANLQDMYQACKGYYDSARSSTFTLGKTTVCHDGEEVLLQGEKGTKTRLTHHAFGQVATMVGAPANYLRSLPAPLAATNLAHGFMTYDKPNEPVMGLFHKNGNLICRCVTSTKYQRIWNWEIVERLMPLADAGWTVPKAHTDNEMPSGLYASNHDMFAFMVDENHRIDDGSNGGLARGFFAINSEVGQSAFKIMTFYYRYVCGNHIVWGAENVQQVKIIHKGSPARNWANTLRVELTKYANQSTKDDQLKIEHAKTMELGISKEEVLDLLFAKRSLGITRKDLEGGYALAEVQYELTNGQDGNPNTVWGMVNGLTRYSQQKPFADERTKLDMAAGKILEMAF